MTDSLLPPQRKLQIFTVFHKHVPPQIYKYLTPIEKHQITLYGVKERVETKFNIVYEINFPIHNPVFQNKNFNEGSSLYHIYLNKLHRKSEFIGFTQYDMGFYPNSITDIYHSADDSVIFYIEFFEKWWLGGQSTILNDFVDENENPITGGLKSYNDFFGTNYTEQNLIDCKMPICNTFVMSSNRFDKMMSWMIQYFNPNLKTSYTCPLGYVFNPGHIIEALTSMYLALETADGTCRFQRMGITHNDIFK
jgi:hypothetical protein